MRPGSTNWKSRTSNVVKFAKAVSQITTLLHYTFYLSFKKKTTQVFHIFIFLKITYINLLLTFQWRKILKLSQFPHDWWWQHFCSGRIHVVHLLPQYRNSPGNVILQTGILKYVFNLLISLTLYSLKTPPVTLDGKRRLSAVSEW